jgi:hypothetical protein
LANIQPALGRQGAIVSVTFTGSGFSSPATVRITGGSGVRALSAQVNSSTSAVATLVLSGAPGGYSLQLSMPGGITSAQAFTVMPNEITNDDTLNVTTFAGPDGGPGDDDGVGPAARFSGPNYSWGDATGTYLYVADSGNAVIRRVTLATGQVITIAGSPQKPGSSDGAGPEVQFGYPWGIWGDGSNLYITDIANLTIRKLNLASGAVTTIAGTVGVQGTTNGIGPAARFMGPTGIWGDGTSLYIADSYATTQRNIRKITLATGAVTTVAGLGNITNLIGAGVGLWGDGTNLWIADSSRHTIRQLVLATSIISTFAGGDLVSGYKDAAGTNARFYAPSAIWGANGSLYVGDSYNAVIRQVSINGGAVTTVAGISGTFGATNGANGTATLSFITGIWVNGSTGYVSEYDNDTIRTVSLADGTVSTLAGKAAPSGLTDAAGVAARFYSPIGISGDANSVYVADYGNSEIRAINPSTGGVTTLAGSPNTFGYADGQGAAAGFERPTGVWSDGTNLYVVDWYANTVRKIVLSSATVTTIAGSATAPCDSVDAVGTAARFDGPFGIWGDGANLYVTDEYNFTIRKIVLATLQVSTFVGQPGVSLAADGVGASATFLDPTGIWGDGTYLYVTDGNSIRKITLATAQVVTIAGDPQTNSYMDGKALSARFYEPLGIWGDGSSLLIADYGNQLIRKMDLTSLMVTTNVGQDPYFGSANGSPTAARFDGPIGVFGDGVNLYILDASNNNIRKVAPVFHDTQFTLSDRQTITGTSGGGAAAALQIGFATISPDAGSTTPSGMTIFSYRPNGILISEAAVPASPLIQSGRIYAEIAGPVNTGLAIANPNNQTVTVNFFFTDASGNDLYAGSTTIGPYGQVAKFLSDPVYNVTGAVDLSNMRSFTFTATLPISVIALRGYNNERNDFLITTLPVAPTSGGDSTPIVFPHYADGGGWTTKIILVNSGDTPITGTIQFFTQGTAAAAGVAATVTANPIGSASTTASTFNYTIAAHSAYKLTTDGTAADANLSGWVRVVPDASLRAPVGLLVFSNRPGAVTVSESGLAAIPMGSAFRVYTQSTGVFGQNSSMQTGIAIANPSNSAVTVTMELLNLSGTSTGFIDTNVKVPANGAYATTLNFVPGLAGAAVPFQGLIRISGANVAVVGLRIQYNERGDYMITTTTPVNEATIPAVSEYVFPNIDDGGGYTTELILFSGAAGQVSSGTVRFYAADGQPLNIQFNH